MLRYTYTVCLIRTHSKMFDYASGVKYCADYELNIATKVNRYSYVARKVKPTQHAQVRPWRYVY